MSSADRHAGRNSAFEAVFAVHADEVFRFCCAIAGETSAGPLLRRVARRAATEFDEDQRDSTEQRKWLLRLAYLESVGTEPAESPVTPAAPAAPAAATPAMAAPAAAAAAPSFSEQVAGFGKTAFGGLFLRELGKLGYPAIADIFGVKPETVRQGVTAVRRALQPHLPREGPMCDVARELMADDEKDAAAESTLAEHLDDCSECPKVEASMAGIAAALDKALPHIAQSLLLAVLREANAYASDAPPSSPEPEAARGRLSRYSRRSLALAGLALVLVTAGALGLGAPSLDRPANVAKQPAEGQGIGGATAEQPVPPCPGGTVRVADHCEPECPDGTVRLGVECRPECPDGRVRVGDDCERECPDGTVRVGDDCDPRVVCHVGELRNGRCVVPTVCRRGVLRLGRCELRAVCPRGTIRVRNGDCVLPGACPRGTVRLPGGVCRGRVTCPRGTTRISATRCRGRIVCPPGTTRDGLVCRVPVRCPNGSRPVGRICELPARCPSGTVRVGSVCELPVVCPPGASPSRQGCIGDVVCPPGTVPQGVRCVRPCPGTLWPVTDPCLKDDEDDPYKPSEPDPPIRPEEPDATWVDRHGDSHGRGHRPGGGRGHDPSHNPGADAPGAARSGDDSYGVHSPTRPAAPDAEDERSVSPPPVAAPAPTRPTVPATPPPRAPAPPAQGHGREHAPGQQGRADRGRGHDKPIPPVAMLLLSAMMVPVLSRAGSRARPSRRRGPGREGGPRGRRHRRERP